MENIILKREVENNFDNHEIFEHQSISDLEELKAMLNKSDKDVVIELNAKDLYKYENILYDRLDKKKTWENIISKVILEQIHSKYRNMEVPNEPINRIKTFNYIKLINPKEVRLHIFSDYNSFYLCEELLNYIDEIVPFKTMIYLVTGFKVGKKIKKNNYDGEYYMWELYDYKIFDGYSEGELSKDIRKLTRKK